MWNILLMPWSIWNKKPVFGLVDVVRGAFWRTLTIEKIDYTQLAVDINDLSRRIEQIPGIEIPEDDIWDETKIERTSANVRNLSTLFKDDYYPESLMSETEKISFAKYQELKSLLFQRAKEIMMQYHWFLSRCHDDLRTRNNVFFDGVPLIEKNNALKTFFSWIDYYMNESQSILEAHFDALRNFNPTFQKVQENVKAAHQRVGESSAARVAGIPNPNE